MQDGICRALPCGSATTDEELPACTDAASKSILTRVDTRENAAPGFGIPLDADGDGCVEPYKNVGGVCKEGAPGATIPAIKERVRRPASDCLIVSLSTPLWRAQCMP
jgi:hypothetical protein